MSPPLVFTTRSTGHMQIQGYPHEGGVSVVAIERRVPRLWQWRVSSDVRILVSGALVRELTKNWRYLWVFRAPTSIPAYVLLLLWFHCVEVHDYSLQNTDSNSALPYPSIPFANIVFGTLAVSGVMLTVAAARLRHCVRAR